LGFSEKEMKHLSYGMVLLPEGKIKSREGLVVEADDIIEKVRKLAEKEITKRTRLSKSKLNERSKKIALASIKYMLLKSDIKKDLVFNPKESISFDGNTGAYILYSYARANSIIKKIRKINKIKIKELNEKEIEIIKELSLFPNLVLSAYRSLNPSLIANYSYRLSKLFNEFYNSYRVLGSENEVFRIYLVKTFKQTIKNSLYLLGIETVEEM
ncbi:MAG: arginine--tRNA ligase, partial [Candidatus Pacearchaeota archaeon]